MFILLIFSPHQMCFIIWVLLIVLCKINFCLTHYYSLLEVLNLNLNLKFYQMDFWFEFFEIHMNEKTITCYDCYDFKWQNINIYSIVTFCFLQFDTLFGSLDYDYTPFDFFLKWNFSFKKQIFLLCCVFMLVALEKFMSYATSC
jgi:hypothetical protein